MGVVKCPGCAIAALLVFTAIIPIVISGCETANLKPEAEKRADTALRSSEWYICRAATVGSVLRRYGSNAELMRAWQILCSGPAADIFYESGQTKP